MTPNQILLLRAALGTGDEAAGAFREWIEKADIDGLDNASLRLLPLTYLNRKRLGIDHPSMRKFEEIYYLTIIHNQRKVKLLGELSRDFSEQGIDVLVLKGMALALFHYKEPGARPMSDVDILVRENNAHQAVKVMLDHGWAPLEVPVEALVSDYFKIWHAQGFKKGEGVCDLHWHALMDCCYEGADTDLWQAARQVEIDGEPAFILNPTDQLFHVCIHGTRWWLELEPAVRWAADAMVILEGDREAINWERLAETAARRCLAMRLSRALLFLRDEMGACVPDEIFGRLGKWSGNELELREAKLLDCSPGPYTTMRVLWCLYRRHLQGAGESGHRPTVLGFLKYLKVLWGMGDWRELPMAIIRKAWFRGALAGKFYITRLTDYARTNMRKAASGSYKD